MEKGRRRKIEGGREGEREGKGLTAVLRTGGIGMGSAINDSTAVPQPTGGTLSAGRRTAAGINFATPPHRTPLPPPGKPYSMEWG